VACLLSGGVNSPATPWFAIAAVTLPARFRARVAAVGGVLIAVAMLAIAFSGDGTMKTPVSLFMNLALVGSIVTFSLALMRSDLDHRSEAFIDSLTGMLNRHALTRRIAELTAQAQVSPQPISLVLVDVDHFKTINDEHGHQTGDEVLTATVRAMRRRLRAEDQLGRLGGEEFLVLLPDTDAPAANVVADSLRTEIAAAPAPVPVTASAGVATWEGEPPETLLRRADEALYAAKRGGRDRIEAAAPATVLRRT
jgi:diguanylate cyclase (GGDEF)-like protein